MATNTTTTDTAEANGAAAKQDSLIDQARSAIEDAVESTVEVIKDHPLAAAGVAAGAAAAVAGAAYGVSKLLDKDSGSTKPSTSKKH